MEMIAWGVYAVLRLAPFVIIPLGVVVVAYFCVRLSFKVNRVFGYAVFAFVIAATVYYTEKYFIDGPASFRAACASGTGLQIVRPVNADSYVLGYDPNGRGDYTRAYEGYTGYHDATILDAVKNVGIGRVSFVEIEDSKTWSRYGLHHALSQARSSNEHSGYFRIFTAPRGSKSCYWLLDRDLELPGGWSYSDYLKSESGNKLKKKLENQSEGTMCIAIEYVDGPSSPYFVEFSTNQEVSDNLYRHQISIRERSAKNPIMATAIAFEYRSENRLEALARTYLMMASDDESMNRSECPPDLHRTLIVRETLFSNSR